MKKTLMIAASLLAVLSCSPKRTNPFLEDWKTPYGIPPFDKIEISDYLPAVKAGIAQQKEEIAKIVANPEAPTFENTIAAYDLSGEILAKVTGVVYNLSETDNSPEMEAVMNEIVPLMTEISDDIFMDAGLFTRVKAIYEADQSSLTREQQMVLKKIYNTFERNGIGLPEDKQAELREINKALSTAEQTFGNNLLAENNSFKDTFGISVSAYSSTMTSTSDRDLRKRLFEAYSSRGDHGDEHDNKALCLEILKLRARKARLLGYDNFAQYQLADKMAKDPGTVDAFLDRIMKAAVAKSAKEIADMQKIMDRDIAVGLLPKGAKIEPWDWFYYAERVRAEKYSLDEELTKPYFLLDNVRDGVFNTASRIYGIGFQGIEGVPMYHPEVKAFKVVDEDDSLLGIFLCDYLPRSSKRGGAWMNNFREQYKLPDGTDVRPIIVNVCNMASPTEDLPSLLSIDNVETMFHEFGHALHGLLTKCNYKTVSGTSVARDFVETFSQFNENWAFQKEILADYARHYETDAVIPDSLVTKILAARKFNQGFMTTELCAASILDMKWHELGLEDLEGIDVAGFEAKACAQMNLPKQIIPRYKTTYFNHIFNSGYSAGYYSYLWSEVLDKDAFEYFEQQGIYDKAIAERFRKIFLERGGSEEPMVLYQMFRGAQPDPDALVRARGLDE